MRLGPFAVLLSFSIAVLPAIARGADDDTPLNPHTRDACIQCHKSTVKSLGSNRTSIFSSRDEPHAAVAISCRSCHKEGKADFWLLVLPSAGGRPLPAEPVKSMAPLKSDKEAAETPSVLGGTEGFENSHDTTDCVRCHEKPADQIKPGDIPPKFAAEGVDKFCRSCHSGIDRTHYTRNNLPRSGTTCLNCHRVHGRALFFRSLRDDFPQFLSESPDINPHGGKIFCLACHADTPQQGLPATFRFPGNSLRLCQRCHSGVEHHPLGVKSSSETWKMDFAGFPLENETITCVTCHKPQECRDVVERDNPRFLRDGPYNAMSEFCKRCHEKDVNIKLNPHDQIDEDGEIYQKKCLYCHVTVPSLTATFAELQFTDSLQALCASCHEVIPHPQVEHMLPLPPVMEAKLKKYEEQRLVHLPIDEDGKVTCITCHNPHERGLIKGAGGIGADEEHRLRITTYNEQCTPCHDRH